MPKGKRSTTPAMLCSAQFRESAKAYMPLTPATRDVLRAMYIDMFWRICSMPPYPSSLPPFNTF
jgi:hypothetical protein